ncbi:hypothetical protein [Craterilacuibacter sp.]|uniref:hypothetical protein n=1 Tax=Craterilacuibacter sp. TaxID=2870909 RepID=UPI003F34C4A0
MSFIVLAIFAIPILIMWASSLGSWGTFIVGSVVATGLAAMGGPVFLVWDLVGVAIAFAVLCFFKFNESYNSPEQVAAREEAARIAALKAEARSALMIESLPGVWLGAIGLVFGMIFLPDNAIFPHNAILPAIPLGIGGALLGFKLLQQDKLKAYPIIQDEEPMFSEAFVVVMLGVISWLAFSFIPPGSKPSGSSPYRVESAPTIEASSVARAVPATARQHGNTQPVRKPGPGRDMRNCLDLGDDAAIARCTGG